MSATAWVTGSAGGIGGAVCRRLSRDGLTVVGFDTTPSPDADHSVVVDLADPDATVAAAHEALVHGEVDAIVHVAAAQPLAAAGTVGADAWADTLMVNVVSLDLLVGVAHEQLTEREGSVVAISSVHAQATTAGIVAYATSKAALEGWVRAASLDLAPHIRVNAVTPGAIETPKLIEGFERWGSHADERREVLETRTPLARIGAADDVANAVAFLLSDQAAFITGSVLNVDGGALVRLGTE